MSQSLIVKPGSRDPTVADYSDPRAIIYFDSSREGLVPGSYATIADLEDISIPDNTQHDYRRSIKERWLRVASRLADTYVGQRFSVPLKLWSDAWIWAICEIAFDGILAKRGFDPTAKTEVTFGPRHRQAMDFILDARDYVLTPDPRLVLTEPDQVAAMVSDPQRGWNGPPPGSYPFGRGGGMWRR